MKIDKIKKHYGFFSLALLVCVVILSVSGISFSRWADEVSVNATIQTGEMDIYFDNKGDSKGHSECNGKCDSKCGGKKINVSTDGGIIVNFKYDSAVPFIIDKEVVKSLEDLGYKIESSTENGNKAEENIFPAREKGMGEINMEYSGNEKTPPAFELKFEQYTDEWKNLND